MATALVTGATGLLGSWLTRALLDRGDAVVALTRDAAAAAGHVDARARLVQGDVTDGPLLTRAVAEHGADTVFHLAAQTIVATAAADPAATYTTNIIGTTTVLEAARLGGARRAVVAGSATAYGRTAPPPLTEDMALTPSSPYDISKAALDLIARSYWPTYGLPVATTRLTNVYGGGDRNGSRLVPELVAAVLAGRPPAIRSDGSPRCDLLYVEDAVDAYLRLADALDDDRAGARGEAFNAGGGVPVSVREVVAALERAAGLALEPRYAASADAPRSGRYVANDKLTRATGWRPTTSLDEGLRRTLAWHADAARAA